MSWLRMRLRTKLFLTYALVALVGVVTVLVVVSALGPPFFEHQMRGMMGVGNGPGGMMGNGSSSATTQSLDNAYLSASMQALFYGALVAACAALLLSIFVSRQIARPVQAMLRATHRIGSGQYTGRVDVPPANRGDELGQLADSFNEMAEALERTERRRVELVGDVAHELRTPVATLQGYMEGLLDGVVEPTPETWAKLHTETGRLRRLVDDLQELSRAEARQIPLRIRAVAPALIVQTAAERLRPQFEEKGLIFQTSAPTDLPKTLADQDRAIQIITNLLTNALRYTPAPGKVTLEARRAGEAIAFRVSDTGQGLTEEQLAQVFERFYRADKSRSRALGGAGIGLTIARALAEAMHGQLTAESAGPGLGSAFTLTLPIAH